MIYLLQVLRLIEDLKHFEAIFSDLLFEIEGQGWEREELVQDLLDSHFGIYMQDDKQIKILSDSMAKPNVLSSAVNIEMLKRAV